MKPPKSMAFLLSLLVVTTFCSPISHAQSGAVSLDHLAGVSVYDSSSVPAGRKISFRLRINNDHPEIQIAVSNSFRIYSPDGATWQPALLIDTSVNPVFPFDTDIDTSYYGSFVDPPEDYIWKGIDSIREQIFDGGIFMNYYTPDGAASDTVSFYAAVVLADGMPPGLNFIGWDISIDSVFSGQAGQILCIDSSYAPPAGLWSWAPAVGPLVFPTWDGPHCFEIVDCCLGVRGNINHDNNDEIDISDLNMMVSYMFRGGTTPPCLAEVNVDGAGGSSIDIADLNWMVAFMFRNGSPPAACQ